MSFGWWPVSFFPLWEVTVWLICRDLWVLALIPPLPPIERCGVREMSASCFLPGACSPSHSCALLCQPHLCPPHLAWRYHQMSPNVTGLFQLVRSLSLSPLSPLSSVLMHCWTKCTLLTVTQPPHGPTGSFTHPVVQPVFVKVHVHVWCKDSKISLFSLSPPHFLFLLLTLPGMREHPPIPVIDLADHIERLKANDGLRFSQEYEVRALNWSVSTIWMCFFVIISGWKFYVYASLIPYACILMD